MRKYFDENGKEVKFGDTVSIKEKQVVEPFGEMTMVNSVVFKEGMEDILENAGWLTHEDILDISVYDVLRYNSKKTNLSLQETIKTLSHFIGIYTDTVVHVIAMSIFNILYSDTKKVTKLMNKEEVFGINRFNSDILNLGKPDTLDLGIIPMFSSKQEAKEVLKLVQSVIKYLNDRK